jgi:recombination protein RecT
MATNMSLKNQLKARSVMGKEIVNSEVSVNPAPKTNLTKPAFKLGSKAYIQLALKTGLYKTLNVIEVYSGQLKYWDPVTEKLIIDIEAKTGKAVIGYAGYFELFNGFKKCVYVTKSSMENRGKTLGWNGANYKKAVLKEMLSKWGILSLDTHSAYVPELHEEVLLYKPLLKEEDIYSLIPKEAI